MNAKYNPTQARWLYTEHAATDADALVHVLK